MSNLEEEDVDVSADVMDLMQQANDAIWNWFEVIVLSDVREANVVVVINIQTTEKRD